MPSPSDPAARRSVEAARYALLRRLALSMRHQMVVHLQPMGMIAELLERRLAAPAPNVAQVHESVGKIHELSRLAVDSCLDVVGWLAPPAGATTRLDESVRECVALLRSSFNFRGFSLLDEVGEQALPVDRGALRHVLPAALFALADQAAPPAELRLSVPAQGGPATLRIELLAGTGTPVDPGTRPYRHIAWGEVECLAAAEGMQALREGAGARIVLAAA